MAGSPPVLEFMSSFLPDFFIEILESLSMLNHFEMMVKGVLRLNDLAYFILLPVFWLGSCKAVLLANKAQS